MNNSKSQRRSFPRKKSDWREYRGKADAGGYCGALFAFFRTFIISNHTMLTTPAKKQSARSIPCSVLNWKSVCMNGVESTIPRNRTAPPRTIQRAGLGERNVVIMLLVHDLFVRISPRFAMMSVVKQRVLASDSPCSRYSAVTYMRKTTSSTAAP